VVAVRTYLVVANQTLPGAELKQAVRKRIQQGPRSFHVLVPNTRPRGLASDLGVGGWARTEQGTGRLWSWGPVPAGPIDLHRRQVQATGELGDPDPLKAVAEVLEHRQVDEILLSTLPKPVSRWRGMDLPHRLQRRFGLPVTTITTKG
jgi:hypothetical protein